MKSQKNAIIYLLIISFVLTACAIPFIPSTGSVPESEDAPAPTETSALVSESTSIEASAEPTMTEATSAPEPETEEMAEEPAAPSGDCHHPYFPVLPDTTWHYQTVTTGLPTIEQYQTFDEISDDSFILHQEIVSETTFYTDVEWFCSEDGLLNSAFAMINLPVMPVEFEFETIEFSGVSYPPAAEWIVGNTWTGSWQMVGTADIPNVGTTQSDIDVVQENLIAAVESVTVPAGTYDEAVRIDSTVTMDVVSMIGETSSPAVTNSFTMSAWFVEGVGLVKLISEDVGSFMELQSMQ